MKRNITKVAVLGSGIMGSRIACHFANAGVSVLLLDIASPEGDPDKIVNTFLQNTLKARPAALYKTSSASLIRTGNFTTGMKDISGCDWVIEVVVENLDIKKKIFDEVEKYRTPGTLITSNTSGIP